MSGTDYTSWHTVKTRLRPDERDWLERTAEQDERSIASVLRRLVREAKDAAETNAQAAA